MAESDNKKKKEEPSIIILVNVVFVLGLAAGVIQPGFSKVSERVDADTKLAKCAANLTLMGQAVEQYRQDHEGRLPTKLNQLSKRNGGCLIELPKCPADQPKVKPSYGDKSYMVQQGEPGRYTIICKGFNHQSAGLEADQPLYDSVYGIRPSLGNLTIPPVSIKAANDALDPAAASASPSADGSPASEGKSAPAEASPKAK